MPKSIHSDPYRTLLDLLRQMRVRRGVRQEDLVDPLGMDQSTISRIEQGERRIDVVELRAYCGAIGWTLRQCVDQWERALLHTAPHRASPLSTRAETPPLEGRRTRTRQG
ncbi:helix-turn-helix transcriptional regulator [Dokdonella soli]|uniref:helix-turn-helix domain-containing protein n=1 Tax=Dokdonella soli TaxID=529810 RepID=UPI0031CFABF2